MRAHVDTAHVHNNFSAEQSQTATLDREIFVVPDMTIAGKPDVLYHLPESVGAENCIKPVTEQQVDMSLHCEDAQEDVNDYQEYFRYICDNEIRISLPTNWRESTELYEQLLTNCSCHMKNG